eukprot:jgi/Pico_ML_1/53943/g4399.t1
MEYRHLGRSGLQVSALSYGAWVTFGEQVDVKHAENILEACRNHGCNFFDNAEVYRQGEAEVVMGKAIKNLAWKRSDVVVSTKIFWGGSGPNDRGLSRKHLIEGTRASLERLQMDYVDLLFCHRPDPSTPIEETVRAMNFLIDHGLTFYWGTSEWSGQQITEAWEVANRLDMIGPLMEQPEYNMFAREKVEVDYAPVYASYKWLAEKKLVEKRDQIEKVDQLKPIAEALGCSLAQLSLAWCVKNPNVSTVITGSTKLAQVEDNFQSMKVVPKLTDEVMAKIEEIIQSKPTAPAKYR